MVRKQWHTVRNPSMPLSAFLPTLPHRKTIRHFDLPGDAHFLTFSCYRRLALLSKDRTRNWFVEALDDARASCKFHLWAWVIMTEHVHLLIHPLTADYRIAAILSAIKRPIGTRAIAHLARRRSPFLERLTVRTRTRTYRRFWQAGPGHDHNVYDTTTAHRIVGYIHGNPVRRGRLAAHPEDWYWSSVRDWAGADDLPIRVDRTLPPLLEIPRDG
jgi:putative transposase